MSPYEKEELEAWFKNEHARLYERICVLEQQVANQALALKNLGNLNVALQSDTALKSQAAQQQATNGLYAPLRSDTRPLLEMSAFVRRVAQINPDHASHYMYSLMRDLVETAKEILKRST